MGADRAERAREDEEHTVAQADVSGTQVPAHDLEKVETRAVAVAGTQATIDEPSAAWGWSGAFPHATRIAGWTVAVIMIIMALFGNHRGHVEDIFLGVTALLMVFVLVRDQRRRKHAWRR
jgi:hypothetical protein